MSDQWDGDVGHEERYLLNLLEDDRLTRDDLSRAMNRIRYRMMIHRTPEVKGAAPPAKDEVKVKELVWTRLVHWYDAKTSIGTYEVRSGAGVYEDRYSLRLTSQCEGSRSFASVEAAKAAAQADYERRILSALEPTPSTDAVRRQAREVADSLENLAGRLEQTATSRELDIATGIREDIAVLRALPTPPAGADEGGKNGG